MEDTKTKAKSKNSRARRLSYVANAEGVGPQVHSSSCLLLSDLAAGTLSLREYQFTLPTARFAAALFGR